MEQLEKRLKEVDIFVELRDARLPISSFNKKIDDVIQSHKKTKMVVFNKWDLCEQGISSVVADELTVLGIPNIKVSSKQRSFDFQKLLGFSRSLKIEKHSTVGLWAMVGGMPNVGKSSLINSLRVLSKSFERNDVAKSTAKPCETTHVTGFKVCGNPLVYVVDTPGILLPSIEEQTMGLNLGLVGIIPPKIFGAQNLIKHLYDKLDAPRLDSMFKKYCFSTRPKCGEDIIYLTMEAFKIKEPDNACHKILGDFQTGEFGKITLDSVYKKITPS